MLAREFVIVLLAMLWASAPYAAEAQTDRPRMIGEGVISTSAYESGPALSPDGTELYFSRRPNVPYFWVICVSRRVGERWSEPQIASFSGREFSDRDAFVTPDGRRLYFSTNRGASGETKTDFDIWYVERRGERWSDPIRVHGVNSGFDELHPSVDASGVLYFSSDRAQAGAHRIYSSNPSPGGFAAPQALDAAINSGPFNAQPAISVDGNLLVFVSIGRADEVLERGVAYARGDLYVSRRLNGRWTGAMRLSGAVNTQAAEATPAITGDGRLLFAGEDGFAALPFDREFSYSQFAAGALSVRNGLGNLYEVDLAAIGLAE